MDESSYACPNCGYVHGNPPKELFHLFPGSELADRYIIGEVLGFGGFGITYKAWDKKLETIVAVKEFYPSGIVNRVPGDKNVIIYAKKRENEFYFGKDRFLEEAKNMAKFNSEPNIINVFEYFEENHTAYIVMEYLDGISLKSFLQDNGGMLDVESALQITEAIAKALSTIHSKGIIHRDVSPDNIFMCLSGEIKLIDFGAARFSQDENKMMTIILKPGFAPPEQYEKVNKQGPWTDVYALGASLYYTITGKKPEESTNRKINDTLPYPHEINPEIPVFLSNTIMKAMAVDVQFRFKNVQEFLDAIHQQVTVLPVAVEKKKRKRRRNIGLSVALFVILAGAAMTAFEWSSEKKEAELEPCEITMWYEMSSDEDLASGEQNAYQSIVDEFTSDDLYPDVKINIQGFTHDEYVEMLKTSEELPNLYELVDDDPDQTEINGEILPLDEVYESDIFKNTSLLRFAESYYGNRNYLPLGFNAPIIFENKTLIEDDSDIKSVDAISKLPESGEGFVHDDEAHEKMFGKEDGSPDQNAKKSFVGGNADFYGTMTNNYRDVNGSLPGQFSIIRYDADKIYCEYSNVWAAKKIDEDQDKAAIRLLMFMLNNSSQDKMHIRNQSENLPVNEDMIKIMVDSNPDFDGFFDNKDKYVFEK